MTSPVSAGTLPAVGSIRFNAGGTSWFADGFVYLDGFTLGFIAGAVTSGQPLNTISYDGTGGWLDDSGFAVQAFTNFPLTLV